MSGTSRKPGFPDVVGENAAIPAGPLDATEIEATREDYGWDGLARRRVATIDALRAENARLWANLDAVWGWLDALPSKPLPASPLGMLRDRYEAMQKARKP